jgi:uncharacterized membrane protein
MKRLLLFLRTTLAGGLLFLVPFAVLLIILGRALEVAQQVVRPLAERSPIDSFVGVRMEKLLALALLFLACFLAGCLARTKLAKKIVAWLETTLLSNIPGYEFFKGIGEGILGTEPTQKWDVVLARTDDSIRIGFLIEHLDNGLVAVFVPEAPSPHSGEVQFLAADRVTTVNISAAAALKCLKRLGAGSSALFGGIKQLPSAPIEHQP